MDHLSLIVFFLSFSSWMAGIGVSFTSHGRTSGSLAVQYRLFCVIFLVYTFQDLIFVYLDNLAGDSLAEWINRLQQTLEILVFSAIAGQLPLLADALRIEHQESPFRRFAYPVASAIAILSLSLLVFGTFADLTNILGFAVALGACLISFLAVGIRGIFGSGSSGKQKRDIIMFSILCLLTFAAVAEDYLIALVDEVIVSPYLLLLFNLFFIRLILKRSKTAAEQQSSAGIPEFLDIAGREYGVTDREKDVLILLLEGSSQAAIAENLFVSANTIKTHVTSIYRKLGVSSRFELMNMASGPDSPTRNGEAPDR